ncbi:MAG: pilus assembly protein TadG-related protein, partial [Ktedonobacterales bacterium]
MDSLIHTADDTSEMRPRARRRQALRRQQRRNRAGRRRRSAGQTLIIFAMSFTILLGLAGLAVDVARAYDLYAHMLRAAEAGALAAVEYMPNNYNTPYAGDSQSAISRASIEVIKNGFGGPTPLPATLPATYFGCPNAPTTFEVVVCPVTGKTNDLQV